MKKNGLANVGGLVSLDRDDWAEHIRHQPVVSEGIPTGGGLAACDLQCMAVSLHETLDEDHLAHRVAAICRLGDRLRGAGIPMVLPFGGNAVYVDGRAFCDHLPDEQLPAWSLSVAFYVASGVRTWEVGYVMAGRRDGEAGAWLCPALHLLRMAVPRRVYSDSHLEYAAQSLIELYQRRREIGCLRFVDRPPLLPQSSATFAPV